MVVKFEVTCVNCGRQLDVHLRPSPLPEPVIPMPGDICVCWKCGHPSSYNEDLRLVPLTGEQYAALLDNEEFIDAMALWWQGSHHPDLD